MHRPGKKPTLNVSDKSALDLAAELSVARSKFQHEKQNRKSSTTSKPTRRGITPVQLESKQMAERYNLVKKGKVSSDLLIAEDFSSDSSASSSDSENEYNERVLHGDIVQRGAFHLDTQAAEDIRNNDADADQSGKQDEHYDADWEVRDKGVGFYKFSQNADTRQAQQASLETMRSATLTANDTHADVKARRDAYVQSRWAAVEVQKQQSLERMARIGQFN